MEQQGDPLSLDLFILMEEVLSRLLYATFEGGRIGKFFHPRGYPLISHLLCADKLHVFTNGEQRSSQRLTLETYGSWSRQAINKAKPTIFLSNKISSTRRRDLLRTTGFAKGSFPFTYLGAPVFPGRLTSGMLEPGAKNSKQ